SGVAAAQVQRVRLESFVNSLSLGDLREQLELAIDLLVTLPFDPEKEGRRPLIAVPEVHPASHLDRVLTAIGHHEVSDRGDFRSNHVPGWGLITALPFQGRQSHIFLPLLCPEEAHRCMGGGTGHEPIAAKSVDTLRVNTEKILHDQTIGIEPLQQFEEIAVAVGRRIEAPHAPVAVSIDVAPIRAVVPDLTSTQQRLDHGADTIIRDAGHVVSSAYRLAKIFFELIESLVDTHSVFVEPVPSHPHLLG